MSKLDFKNKLFLYTTKIKKENIKKHIEVQDTDQKRNFTIGNVNKNDIYIFENYEEYKKYFLMYLDKIDLILVINNTATFL